VDGTHWRVQVPVGAGENLLPITAREAQVSVGRVPQQSGGTLAVNVPQVPPRTLSYDANGNLLWDGQRSYQWDAENRLVRITHPGGATTLFAYDGLGRRVLVSESQDPVRHHVWEGLRLAAEYDAYTGDLQRRYWSEGEEQFLPPGQGGPAIPLYYVRDHLGSVRELVDAEGRVRARYDYGLWGERHKLAGDLETSAGYTGHYYHAPSALHLAPYRAYSADLGRWLSRDPIGKSGGINLYGYVGNGTANGKDLLGLYITYGGGGSERFWKNYRKLYSQMRACEAGRRILDKLEGSETEIRLPPTNYGGTEWAGSTYKNGDGSIQANIDDKRFANEIWDHLLPHELYHAVEQLYPYEERKRNDFDPLDINVDCPQDKLGRDGIENRASRAANMVLGKKVETINLQNEQPGNIIPRP
jgi:RHS repeat-associated protein